MKVSDVLYILNTGNSMQWCKNCKNVTLQNNKLFGFENKIFVTRVKCLICQKKKEIMI